MEAAKLQTLEQIKVFWTELKVDVTFEQLDAQAVMMSENEAALALNNAR